MNIRGMPAIVRQPTSYVSQDRRLIFTYPMLIDESLQKYASQLRDFFAIVFTGEIKIANTLQIISTVFDNPIAANEPSPAEILYRNITENPRERYFKLKRQELQSSQTPAEYSNTRYQLQEHIKSQIQFISKFIKTNPRYSRLRPCISVITIQGDPLINIPLIIGTYPYYTNTSVLYWILMMALGFNLPLNNRANLNKIAQYLKYINENNFYELIFNDTARQKLLKDLNIPSTTQSLINNYYKTKTELESARTQEKRKQAESNFKAIEQQTKNIQLQNEIFSRLNNTVFNNVNKTFAFYDIVLNAARWDRYSGVNTTRNAFSTAIERINPRYFANIDSASALFSSFVSNEVVHIINSYVNLFETATASPRALISQLLESNFGIDFQEYGHLIINQIQNSVNYSEDRMQSADNALLRLSTMCERLNQYDVTQITNKLVTASLPTTYANLQEVAAFHNTVENEATALYNIALSIVNSLDSIIANTNIARRFRNTFLEIQQMYHDLFFTEDPRFGRILEPIPIGLGASADDANAHPRWAAVNGVSQVTPDLYADLEQIAESASNSLTYITFFFFVFSLVSFLCKSIDIIKFEFETVKKDATDWPNYCLVLPLSFVSGLFVVSQLRDFKSVLNNPQQIQSLTTRYRGWSANEVDVKRIINRICYQLMIPNIIVVDEKTDTMYYRFMFMEKPEKVKLSTVNTYIKSQHDLMIVK